MWRKMTYNYRKILSKATTIIAWWYGMPMHMAKRLALKNTGGQNIAYRTSTSDEGVLQHSFEKDIFLPNVPEYLPKRTDIVLDVGSHLGDFSLLISSRVHRVFALEPCRETFALLKTNVLINYHSNIVCDRIALSDMDGVSKLFLAPPGGSWADSTVYSDDLHTGQFQLVKTSRLETYLRERNIVEVDFAKFNVEGAEFRILLSSKRETLRKIRIMLILYHCDICKDTTEGELAEHLHSCGFKTYVRNKTESRGWLIAERC
jgi:FkbM family methyltransferase